MSAAFLSFVMTLVLRESRQAKFDPKLVASIIATESGFNPRKHGTHGEIGLMQLKPATARWIARRCHMKWGGARSLEVPATNIRLGLAYLSYLREQFKSRPQLYLSAYNMGAANVRRALARRIMPREYFARVRWHYSRMQFQAI